MNICQQIICNSKMNFAVIKLSINNYYYKYSKDGTSWIYLSNNLIYFEK
jgi:hypothetical protein